MNRNSRATDITETVYYIHRPEMMKLIFLSFQMCHERWALQLVIKRKVFIFIFCPKLNMPLLIKRNQLLL